MLKKIAITSGDSDGIGLEIISKALLKLGPQKNVQFFLFRNYKLAKANERFLSLLNKKFSFVRTANLNEALEIPIEKDGTQIFEICSKKSAAHWVLESALACRENLIDGLVTAPLSKTLIYSSGLNSMGHTEILKSVSGEKNVRMAFLGNSFNVVLVTDHIPLGQVQSSLSRKTLYETILLTEQLRKQLGLRMPLCLLGLNPHAGEAGLLGKDESKILQPTIKIARSRGIKIDGPISPDAAFLPTKLNKYSFFIANYHDQGLIPFKAIHGQDSGVHLSMGLPFVRTSVDHGTAKDIFGKNIANPNSMIEAIGLCEKLIKS